jgi:hypothetical protein
MTGERQDPTFDEILEMKGFDATSDEGSRAMEALGELSSAQLFNWFLTAFTRELLDQAAENGEELPEDVAGYVAEGVEQAYLDDGMLHDSVVENWPEDRANLLNEE